MADIADMLKNMLDDPSTMDKLKGMLGGAQLSAPGPSSEMGIDPAMLMRLSKIMKNDGTDNRTKLLLDLKPYISPHRQKRVDEAINILKVLRLAELVKNDEEN